MSNQLPLKKTQNFLLLKRWIYDEPRFPILQTAQLFKSHIFLMLLHRIYFTRMQECFQAFLQSSLVELAQELFRKLFQEFLLKLFQALFQRIFSIIHPGFFLELLRCFSKISPRIQAFLLIPLVDMPIYLPGHSTKNSSWISKMYAINPSKILPKIPQGILSIITRVILSKIFQLSSLGLPRKFLQES